MRNAVGWSGLAASLIFVAVAIGVSASQRLALEREMVVAVARSLVQLLIVGVALLAVVDDDTPLIWSWLWVAVIVFFAGATVARRVPAIPGMLWVAVGANAAVAAVSLAIVYGFNIFPLSGRTLVPVAGMTIGNSLKSGVVGATRVVEIAGDHRAEIEARLALGLPGRDALRPFLRSALRTAISPQIENTAGLGIVFLPGAMTGLILAGVSPMAAVRTQLALMYVILAGVAITTIAIVLGAARLLMTPDDRLLPVARRMN